MKSIETRVLRAKLRRRLRAVICPRVIPRFCLHVADVDPEDSRLQSSLSCACAASGGLFYRRVTRYLQTIHILLRARGIHRSPAIIGFSAPARSAARPNARYPLTRLQPFPFLPAKRSIASPLHLFLVVPLLVFLLVPVAHSACATFIAFLW